MFKLLLPKDADKRVYNMKDKQIVKAISSIVGCSVDDMLTDLEQGDCPQTCKDFFVKYSSTYVLIIA